MKLTPELIAQITEAVAPLRDILSKSATISIINVDGEGVSMSRVIGVMSIEPGEEFQDCMTEPRQAFGKPDLDELQEKSAPLRELLAANFNPYVSVDVSPDGFLIGEKVMSLPREFLDRTDARLLPAKPPFPPNQLMSEGALRMETRPVAPSENA